MEFVLFFYMYFDKNEMFECILLKSFGLLIYFAEAGKHREIYYDNKYIYIIFIYIVVFYIIKNLLMNILVQH